jgi:hypothetical protein
MFGMRNAALGAVAATVMSLAGFACASSDDSQSESAFCDSLQTVLDEGYFDQTGSGLPGSGLVQLLRKLNTTGLADADRDEFSSAIDLVEEQIAAYNDGAPDGWSTEPVSSVASRICDVEIGIYSVRPS